MGVFDKDKWQEIFGTIRKNKLRTGLTALGVFWGIFMLVFLLGMGNGLENGVYRDFGSGAKNIMYTWTKRTSMPYAGFGSGREIKLKLDDIEALKREVPELYDSAPRNNIGAQPITYKDIQENYEVRGELTNLIDLISLVVHDGRYLNQKDIDDINSAKSNVELGRIRVIDAKKEMERIRQLNDQKLSTNQAKINYETAKAEEERNRDLFKEGITSKSQYDQFTLDLELKKSIYDNAKISTNNDLRRANIDLDIRTQEYNAAVNNLQLLREGATKNSGQVSNVILSTVDGMVLDIPNEEGSSVIERNNFNEGTTIATIADMTNLIFEGKVDESDVGKLKGGMPLIVTVGAVLDTVFNANLEFISPKGVDEEGSIKFEIKAALEEIPNGIFLRAGYSANADVILQKIDQVVAIQERDVIYEDDDKTYVEIGNGNDSYTKKEVSLGLSDGLYVQVLTGLDTTMVIKKRTDPQANKAN